MLNLNANGFTGVTNQFSLTLPSPTMISVILLELEYHLLISTWTKIVIFHAITGLRAVVFCRLFQINLQFQLLQEPINPHTFHA